MLEMRGQDLSVPLLIYIIIKKKRKKRGGKWGKMDREAVKRVKHVSKVVFA
jgi:hypothetical protein